MVSYPGVTADGAIGVTAAIGPASSAVAPGFEAWYFAEHERLVAALVWVAGDPEVARDAADEAFARALLHWRRVGAMASPGGWTYKVALNVLRRSMRRATHERRLFDQHRPDLAIPAPAGEIWAVVRGLPERQRVAIVLRYLLDLPEREVARVMGIAPGTAASSLAAARARLATWLDDEADQQGVRG
jgi:RNA polymerase sigma-70 factor (ECF subfamily)